MKARKRKGRGGYVVDYRDRAGVRHEPVFDTKLEAQTFIDTEGPKLRRLNPSIDAAMTVRDYMVRYLARIQPTVRPSSFAGYESVTREHIVKMHGDMRICDVEQTDVYDFLAGRLKTHSKNTVRRIAQVYQRAFAWAMREKLRIDNPAKGLADELKLVTNRKVMAKNIKAMDRPQLQQFLATTLLRAPDLYPLWVFMVRNGFRPGEAYGAGRPNLNLDHATFYVDEALSSFDGKVGDPKTDGSVGLVQLTPQTVRVMRAYLLTQPVGQQFLFLSRRGKPHDHKTMNERMKRILGWAGLPLHFTPHCLRHTYASQSLAEGENISFVQQQLRHASVTLTADLYGKWLPKKRMLPAGALDDDAASDLRLAAAGESA